MSGSFEGWGCVQCGKESTLQLYIFAATDNHIGFMEKDPVRFNDSIEAFEEVLQIAKAQDVSNL